MATPPEYHTLVQKLEQLGIDIGLLGRFVQGGDAETVLLGGAATPTLRKLARDIDARESAAARDVIDRGMADIADKSAAVQALVDTAQSIVDAVKRISATAETVEPDRPAAADYTPATGRILFSIPRGRDGRQGPAGPPGQAPVVDVICCGGAAKRQITVIACGSAASFKTAEG